MAKIKYNLKNAYYAVRTENSETGAVTFGTPKRLPGAVSLSLSQEGEELKEYADGIVWWSGAVNGGYSGDFEMEVLPDDFKVDVLGFTKDDKGVLFEDADATGKSFAFLFQFDTDGDKGIRMALYNCTCTRPELSGSTNEDGLTIAHDTLSITAVSSEVNGKNLVKAATAEDVDATVYDGWFSAVYTGTAQD